PPPRVAPPACARTHRRTARGDARPAHTGLAPPALTRDAPHPWHPVARPRPGEPRGVGHRAQRRGVPDPALTPLSASSITYTSEGVGIRAAGVEVLLVAPSECSGAPCVGR